MDWIGPIDFQTLYCMTIVGKGHTFDTAPLSERTSLQRRSGVARIV